MSRQTYDGVNYETLRASTPEGFVLELYRLQKWGRRQLLAEVWRAEKGDEPAFDVFFEERVAAPDFVQNWIEEAKEELQNWRNDWAANNPDLL